MSMATTMLDNATMKNFFGLLKSELRYLQGKSRCHLQAADKALPCTRSSRSNALRMAFSTRFLSPLHRGESRSHLAPSPVSR